MKEENQLLSTFNVNLWDKIIQNKIFNSLLKYSIYTSINKFNLKFIGRLMICLLVEEEEKKNKSEWCNEMNGKF